MELTTEAEMWLNQTLLENRKSIKEIREELQLKFNVKLPEEKLRQYATENLPEWKERTVEDIEQSVEAEINRAPIDEEFVTEAEKKLDQTKKHRRVLKEIWENYQRIKFDKRQEQNKTRYIDLMSKELDKLQVLEEQERGFLSVLEEVKKSEDEEQIENFRDYVEGYVLPKIVSKAGNGKKAEEQLNLLAEKVSLYKKILEKNNDLIEANKIYLQELYKS